MKKNYSFVLSLLLLFIYGCLPSSNIVKMSTWLPYSPKIINTSPNTNNIYLSYKTKGKFYVYGRIYSNEWKNSGGDWFGVISYFDVHQFTPEGIKVPTYINEFLLKETRYGFELPISPFQSKNFSNNLQNEKIKIFIRGYDKRPGNLKFIQYNNNNRMQINSLEINNKNFILDNCSNPYKIDKIENLTYILNFDRRNIKKTKNNIPQFKTYEKIPFELGITYNRIGNYRVKGNIGKKDWDWDEGEKIWKEYLLTFTAELSNGNKIISKGLYKQDDMVRYYIDIASGGESGSYLEVNIHDYDKNDKPPKLTFCQYHSQDKYENSFIKINKNNFILGRDILPEQIEFQSGKYPTVHLHYKKEIKKNYRPLQRGRNENNSPISQAIIINSELLKQNIIIKPRLDYISKKIIIGSELYYYKPIFEVKNGKPRLHIGYGWLDFQVDGNQYQLDVKSYIDKFIVKDLNENRLYNVLVSIQINDKIIFKGFSDENGIISFINWGFSYQDMKINTEKHGYVYDTIKKFNNKKYILLKKNKIDFRFTKCKNEDIEIHHKGWLEVKNLNGEIIGKLDTEMTSAIPWPLDQINIDYKISSGAYQYKVENTNNIIDIIPIYAKSINQSLIVIDVTDNDSPSEVFKITKNSLIYLLEKIGWEKMTNKQKDNIKIAYSYGGEVILLNSINEIKEIPQISKAGSEYHTQIQKAFSLFNNVKGYKQLVYILSSDRALVAKSQLLTYSQINNYIYEQKKFDCLLVGNYKVSSFWRLTKKLHGNCYWNITDKNAISYLSQYLKIIDGKYESCVNHNNTLNY